MGSAGMGAIVGVLWLARRPTVLGLGRVTAVAGATFGAGLVAFSLSRWLWLSMPLLAFTGAGMMVQMAASNTLLQTLVAEDKRGRVMSFYTMAFFGMMPFGSLAAGWGGAHFGAPMTVLAGGVATLVSVVLYVRKFPQMRREARPVYVKLGILPEIAEGLERASDLPAED
jgi:MFS family permease